MRFRAAMRGTASFSHFSSETSVRLPLFFVCGFLSYKCRIPIQSRHKQDPLYNPCLNPCFPIVGQESPTKEREVKNRRQKSARTPDRHKLTTVAICRACKTRQPRSAGAGLRNSDSVRALGGPRVGSTSHTSQSRVRVPLSSLLLRLIVFAENRVLHPLPLYFRPRGLARVFAFFAAGSAESLAEGPSMAA